ncbi:MAG TPA: ABC transporter permease [Vicinamibacterales bacterium]
MRRLIEAWQRLRSIGRRGELDAGLDDEIRFHIDQQTERYLRAGLTPDEARRQAQIRFGGLDRTVESTRDQFRAVAIEDFLRDLRHGARALLRAPGFTTVATLTLALGIGATTAMFSVVNGVLLRPLPYPDQERLVELVHRYEGDRLLGSPAVYFGYRDHSRTFDAVGLWDWDSSPVTVTGGGEPESVRSVEVTHDVLGMLGATPVLGRSFRSDDDVPGAAPTAVISHAYWQRRFGGASPIGQTLVVNGIAREIVGVLPESFRFFDYPADIVLPMPLVRAEAGFLQGDGRGLARLKPGVTLEQANADVQRMLPLLNAEDPDIPARSLRTTSAGGLALFLELVGIYGLVSYAVAQRRREIGIRLALGAGHGAVRRLFVRNALVLVAAGVGLGLPAAAVLTRLMTSQLFGVSPLDPAMHLGVVLLLGVAAGLAAYVAARRASSLDPVEVLKGVE